MKELTAKEYQKKIKLHRRLAFSLKTIIPIGYFLFLAGVFDDGILQTSTGVKSTIWLVLLFLVYRVLSMIKKRSEDPNNTNYIERSLGSTISEISPWLILSVVLSIVFIGFANIYQHVMVFSVLQIVGGIFSYKEKFWILEAKEPRYTVRVAEHKPKEVTEGV